MQLCKKIYILKPKSYYISVTKLYRNSVQPWFPSLCKPALWRGENVSRAVRHRHRQQQLHQDEINRVETTGWAFTAAEMEKQHENIYIKPDFKSTPEPCLSVDIKTDSSRELLKTSRLPLSLSLFFFYRAHSVWKLLSGCENEEQQWSEEQQFLRRRRHDSEIWTK